MRSALINGRILTPEGLVEGAVLLLSDGRIEALVNHADPRCRDAGAIDLGGDLLLPGFIDVQVNGGGGVLFNDDPSVGTIRTIGAAHREFGTTGFLPTLISDDIAVIERAIRAVQTAIDQGVPGVLGIHIEGPFLNPEFKGIHRAEHLRLLDPLLVPMLSQLRGGKTLLTLAPEMTTPDLIAALSANGVVVSAGHSNASYAETMTAIARGLRGFTHLFNAMPPLRQRAPGIVGAALEDQSTWCGIIVDGHHVDPVVLRLALRCKRHDRFMLVTDAMPTVGFGSSAFDLQGKPIRVVDGVYRDEHGTIAGSALDMAGAVRNAIELLGLDLGEAAALASHCPAEFLGLGDELGRIVPGCRANLALMDRGMRVRRTWVDGSLDA